MSSNQNPQSLTFMSQEASTDQIVSESSQFITPQSGTMDNCADGLMNDIFADLDQILDGSGNLPSQPAKPEYQPQPTIMSNMVMSPVQPTPPARYSQLSTVVVNRTPLTRKRSSRRPARPWFSPILSLGTIASVATVAVIWLLNQGAFNRLIMAKSTSTATQNKLEVQADLVNYIQQSLAAIDQQKPTNNQTAAKVSIGLPPIPGANSTTQPPTTQPLIERLYIPMYQPPQPINYAPPALPPIALPSPQLSQPVHEVPKTSPAMPNTLSVIRPATKPVVVPQVVAYHPQVLPQLPIALPAPPPPTQKIALAIPSSAMTPKYMLKGVLELGAKSAALFDIEGVPHPVQIGEGIGESGWTLVEVGNGEAVIRRNGEVRSVYPLQRF